MKLHVIGVNAAHQLMHTLRESDGTWQTGFGNVNGILTGGGLFPITAIDAECVQMDNNKLHICLLGEGNRLYVAVRNSGGSWTGIEDLSTVLNNFPGLNSGYEFTRVACTRVGNYLQIFLLTRTGQIAHVAFMNASGGSSWWRGTVLTDTSQGQVIDITAFSHVPGGKTRVIIGTATETGRVVRYRFRCTLDMQSRAPIMDTINVTTPILRVTNDMLTGLRTISGNESGGNENFLVGLSNGQVLHHESGQQHFANINGPNNATHAYSDVGCFDINGKLHVAVVRTDGVPFHTYRRSSNGNWQGFMGNVSTQSPGQGVLRTIALG